jgi:hypothetical protein
LGCGQEIDDEGEAGSASPPNEHTKADELQETNPGGTPENPGAPTVSAHHSSSSPCAYVGHYVVVVGCDISNGKIFYRDPNTSEAAEAAGVGPLCCDGVQTFDDARSARGTDHDTIEARIFSL